MGSTMGHGGMRHHRRARLGPRVKLEHDDNVLELRCGADENSQLCVDSALRLLDRVVALRKQMRRRDDDDDDNRRLGSLEGRGQGQMGPQQ